MEKYSVLMSVYKKENPDFFKKSISSMLEQTIKPNEFVLVCDGPLTKELDGVIELFVKKNKKMFKVVRFEENKGLGCALNRGILECSNELIARMDSDDIAVDNRCEKQLYIFNSNSDVSIVGGNIAEFTSDPQIINSYRIVPEKQNEIIKFLKKRSPFNHPSVMYKKSDVIRAGNYKDVRNMQDYFLWIDMFSAGMIGYNIQDVLVYMRADSNLYKRRSGKDYRRLQKKLMKYMKEKKLVNSFEYFFYLWSRYIVTFLPNSTRKILYKNFLRKKVSR